MIQDHQVIRRGDGAAPYGQEGYAPISGSEVPVSYGPRTAEHIYAPSAQELPSTPVADVTVILYSSGASPELIAHQLDAVRRQTVQPAEVWIHVDGPTGHDERTLSRLKTHRTQTHFGRFFRVSLARNAATQWVAILDEDTVPGPAWLERCIGALQASDPNNEQPFGAAVLASSGSVLASDDPGDVRVTGPELPRDEATSVDFGRQGWVFSSALARVMDSMPRVGESAISFGFALSAGAAAASVPTIVLDYGVDRQAWLALSESRIVSARDDVYEAYLGYREMGWAPSFGAAGMPADEPEPAAASAAATTPAMDGPGVTQTQSQAGGVDMTVLERVLQPHESTPDPVAAQNERVLSPAEQTPQSPSAASEQLVAPTGASPSAETERLVASQPPSPSAATERVTGRTVEEGQE